MNRGRRNAVADLEPLFDGLGCLTGNPDHPLPPPRRRGGHGAASLEPMVLAFQQMGYGEAAHASGGGGGGGGGGASVEFSTPSSHSSHYRNPNRLSGDEYGASMIAEGMVYVQPPPDTHYTYDVSFGSSDGGGGGSGGGGGG